MVRQGINLGNTLEALPSTTRRLPSIVEHLDVIREAGFDTIRLPIVWSQHASRRAPFSISARFFAAVDTMILGALERDLAIIVDVHHYDELCVHPAAHRRRFLALWTQIAERYTELPSTVSFELLNEPHRRLTGQRWNDLLADALAVVRTAIRTGTSSSVRRR